MSGSNPGVLRTREQWKRMFQGAPLTMIVRVILADLSGYSTNLDLDRETLLAALEALIEIVREAEA